uniref:hAT-like transposase RNase-H fold domain-containing protein n=1 Tax=Aegilops tauschii subsp. strangulata TaxID=200361 RepID=A0A453BLS1_AEGTS
ADSMDENTSQVPHARRSKVWEHYEVDLVLVDGDLKAVCKYRGAQLHTRFGTSSLTTHIVEACRSIQEACRKRFLLTMKRKPSEGLFVFDEKVCREHMVKYCIHVEIPFLKFEDPHLQPWIDSMQPAFQIKGRHTIRDDAVKMYKGMKKDIEAELQNLDSRICLTSDMWTSSQLGLHVHRRPLYQCRIQLQEEDHKFRRSEVSPHRLCNRRRNSSLLNRMGH